MAQLPADVICNILVLQTKHLHAQLSSLQTERSTLAEKLRLQENKTRHFHEQCVSLQHELDKFYDRIFPVHFEEQRQKQNVTR
mgnify:CR=1 FL=1